MAVFLEREKLKAYSEHRRDAHLWHSSFGWCFTLNAHKMNTWHDSLWLGIFSSLFVLFLIAYFFTLRYSASLLFLCSYLGWLLELMTIIIKPWLVSIVKCSNAFDGALVLLCWVNVQIVK